jgi:hypothetical protein
MEEGKTVSRGDAETRRGNRKNTKRRILNRRAKIAKKGNR